MTAPDGEDLWASLDAQPRLGPNPFDQGASPDLHAAWERQQAEQDAKAAVLADGRRNRIRLTPASAFQIRPVRWTWDQRMPVGELTLIPGREGVGKSTFLAWLASAITNGNLPGIHHGQPKAVLYAASEDAWSYTIAPRMQAAGANLELVYRIDVLEDDGPAGLILPRDCRYLPDIAAEVDAAALMCDPILSLVDDNINSFKSAELRKALEPLRRAAEQANMAVPALVHFNKGNGSDVNTMIAGSRAWAEVARAVIAIAQDKEADDYTCIVSQAKNNLGRLDLPNVAYTIDSVTLETEEGDPAIVGRLRWLGEVDVSAEELLNGGAEERPLSDTAAALVAYIDELGYGVSVQDVANHFPDIKYETVKKTLNRCAKRGHLERPTLGLYAPTKTGKRRNTTPKTGRPLYPPVPTVPLSPPQVRGGMEEERSVPGGVPRDKIETGDTRDTGTGDSGARAHTPTRAHTREEHTPPRQLIACSICYRPIEENDTGHCDTCKPRRDLQ